MAISWRDALEEYQKNPPVSNGWCGMGKEEFIEAFERSIKRCHDKGTMNNLNYLKALYDLKRMKNGECTFLNLDK